MKGLGFLVLPVVRPASATIKNALSAAVRDAPTAPADLKPSKEGSDLQVRLGTNAVMCREPVLDQSSGEHVSSLRCHGGTYLHMSSALHAACSLQALEDAPQTKRWSKSKIQPSLEAVISALLVRIPMFASFSKRIVLTPNQKSALNIIHGPARRLVISWQPGRAAYAAAHQQQMWCRHGRGSGRRLPLCALQRSPRSSPSALKRGGWSISLLAPSRSARTAGWPSTSELAKADHVLTATFVHDKTAVVWSKFCVSPAC